MIGYIWYLWLYFTKYRGKTFARIYWCSFTFETKHSDGRDITCTTSQILFYSPWSVVSPAKMISTLRQKTIQSGKFETVRNAALLAWTKISKVQYVALNEGKE